MIEVEGLTKRYGRATAVDGVSFKVEKGEILGFLGPNGAGKTTTMRILTCYMPPTEGSARVAGHDVFSQPMEVKKRVGYLPETPPLYPDMTVRDYLDFCAKIKGVAGGERKTRVADAIEKCRVGDVRDKLIAKLSMLDGRVNPEGSDARHENEQAEGHGLGAPEPQQSAPLHLGDGSAQDPRVIPTGGGSRHVRFPGLPAGSRVPVNDGAPVVRRMFSRWWGRNTHGPRGSPPGR